MNADEDKQDANGKDDKDVRAAEYVLGTLDPDERTEAQAAIASDPEFVALVHKWERRLGELNVLVAPVEPPSASWDQIKARIGSEAGGAAGIADTAAVEPAPAPPVVPADSERPEVAAVEPPQPPGSELREPRLRESELREPELGERVSATPGAGDVIVLRRRVRRWRRIAALTGAIAAALAALIVGREYRPDLLPPQLRPVPTVRLVEKPVEVPSQRPAQYVAVLQKDAASPAFLLTFDLNRRTLAVRRVGAEAQPGKSYELWLIAENSTTPRSLGLIGGEEFTLRPEPATDPVVLSAASYAVSLEPEGGSPTGAPSGPVLYTGKLIQTTPRGFDLQTP